MVKWEIVIKEHASVLFSSERTVGRIESELTMTWMQLTEHTLEGAVALQKLLLLNLFKILPSFIR